MKIWEGGEIHKIIPPNKTNFMKLLEIIYIITLSCTILLV